MKILLTKDLHFIEHVALEQVRLPVDGYPVPKEVPSVTNEIRKRADETLDVETDTESEKAEHSDGYTWFILSETGQRFQIRNNDFIADQAS